MRRILLVLFLILFGFSLAVQKVESGNQQNYILIFFSDMSLSPAPTLYTEEGGVYLISRGSFYLPNLNNMTQVNLHIHYKGENYLDTPFWHSNCFYNITINGKVFFSDSVPDDGVEYWKNVTLGTEVLKEGENMIEITLYIGKSSSYGSSLIIYTDSYLYISEPGAPPPFLVTTDIQDYLAQLRAEQIHLRQTLEDQENIISQLSNQVESLQNQVIILQNQLSQMTYILIGVTSILMVNLAVTIYLVKKGIK